MTVLTHTPALAPVFARGAVLSPFKRPRPEAEFPRTPLVLPGLRVDLSRLAAYERVCGVATGEDALPLTYPHVLGFPLAMRLMSGRDFPLPLLGLVHTSIEITARERLAVHDSYEIAVYVQGLAPHRRGTQATLVTELRGSGGKAVWESRSTYLARHRTQEGGDGTSVREERVPGVLLPVVAEWRLGGDVGRRYAAVSGDRNPIHLHPLTARPFGFPRAIAHGMWTVARCLAAYGAPAVAHVTAEFRAPVGLPGVVRYGSEPGRFELRGETGRLHVLGRVS
ncbi:MaoC/PaaZ C-terminal domain-containing protein [Streptomyces sp. GXMU-J15]|uniref:MaoC/PaaZ C-terminal domain-containing protein n=1 Tax=Streptomyces fuscus TaxID=3048495 RepID=A0ABT7J9J5_9ACTN|nr:MaoC/PaaZ C-terminal domain-containing protein [Streptomyces fuscus]MDL2081549.1 MaoC/PaaZ C-terminal domain-containing protein [Streptomyces fuscus]